MRRPAVETTASAEPGARYAADEDVLGLRPSIDAANWLQLKWLASAVRLSGSRRPDGVMVNWAGPSLRSRVKWHYKGMLPDEERRQYAARQYESLREEIGQARQAQHTILQWTQALAGTLFAAALVAGTAKTSRYLVAAQFVLGLVLPAVLLGGALAWSGELVRMTRAGVFLRSFERSTIRSVRHVRSRRHINGDFRRYRIPDGAPCAF